MGLTACALASVWCVWEPLPCLISCMMCLVSELPLWTPWAWLAARCTDIRAAAGALLCSQHTAGCPTLPVTQCQCSWCHSAGVNVWGMLTEKQLARAGVTGQPLLPGHSEGSQLMTSPGPRHAPHTARGMGWQPCALTSPVALTLLRRCAPMPCQQARLPLVAGV
jgi:hypothetical protein